MQQSLLWKRCGVETSAWCLASGAPCGWSSSWPGLHLSFSFSSHLSPSCGTCGSGMSHVCYNVVMVGKQEEHSSPGNQWWELCCPFWGWSWKSPHGCYHLHHCWACHLRLWQTSGRQAQGIPSCGCAGLRKIQRPASHTSYICSWHCSAL